MFLDFGDRRLDLRPSGTQTGDFLGIPPTGRRFSVPECLVYQMDDGGRVVNQWTYVDSGMIAKQLGYGFAPDRAE